jgi:hypothetical protein
MKREITYYGVQPPHAAEQSERLQRDRAKMLHDLADPARFAPSPQPNSVAAGSDSEPIHPPSQAETIFRTCLIVCGFVLLAGLALLGIYWVCVLIASLR